MATMFDCCLRRPWEAKESSENLSPRRTFLMSATGRQPSLGHLSAARADYASSELEESSSEGRSPRPYVIRAMRPEELDEAFKIRLQTNYVFAKSTIETSWKMQPDSFLVAVSDEGEMYGTVSMVRYSEGVAYLSLLVVKEGVRSRRIGTELLLAVLDKCGDDNKYMRCVTTLEPLFDRMHLFMLRSDVSLGRTRAARLDPKRLELEHTEGVTITRYEEDLWDKLRGYDVGLASVDRSHVVKVNVEQEGAVTEVALRPDGSVAGYSVVHAMTDRTWYFYMLAADSPSIACMLIHSFITCCPGANEEGLVFVSPLYPSEEESFVVKLLGLKVTVYSVSRFSDYELKFDYARIFSM